MITVDIDELNSIPDELLLELSGAVAGRYAAYLRIENTELKRQLAEREWQPIETAPKDGGEVLAWLHLPKNPIASGPVIACKVFVEENDPESCEEYRRTIGCWWANGRYYHNGSDTGYITHWMPLPPAPKQGETEK